MSHARKLLLACLVLGLVFGFARIVRGPAPEPAAAAAALRSGTVSEKPRQVDLPRPAGVADSGTALSGEARASVLATPAAERDRLIEEITEAYSSYSPEALPKLSPHLRHADPEIRAYALEAVVQVGHASGAELLRSLSKSLADPREAVAFLDAADFLELPPAPPAAVFSTSPSRRTSAAPLPGASGLGHAGPRPTHPSTP